MKPNSPFYMKSFLKNAPLCVRQEKKELSGWEVPFLQYCHQKWPEKCATQNVQAKIKLLLSAKTPHVVSEVRRWSVRTVLTSPQTRGWCTIWSTASRSRCFPLQASRCLHTPHHQRSGTSLHWCPHTGRSFASRHDHRLCYTAGKVFSDWLCWFSSRKTEGTFCISK